MLAGAIALLVYWHAIRRPISVDARQGRFLVLIAVLLAIFLVATPAGTVLSSRFDLSNSLEQQSLKARLSELTEAWQLIAAHPLLGVGANCYLSAIEPLLPPGIAHGGQVSVVHNAYLLAFAELGFLGPLLLALALLSPAWHTLRFGGKPEAAAVAAALAACSVLGLVDYYIWSLPSFRLLWVVLLALWATSVMTPWTARSRTATRTAVVSNRGITVLLSGRQEKPNHEEGTSDA
jgi:O-antigen ligase